MEISRRSACITTLSLLAASLLAANSAHAYNIVAGPLITSYDVNLDNNRQADTRAVSQLVQMTSLAGVPQSSWQLQSWLETDLVDYFLIDYKWGPPPKAPNLSGQFYTFFFGLGSFKSAVWAIDSNGDPGATPSVRVQPAITQNYAPATFEVSDQGRTVKNVHSWNYPQTMPDQAAYYALKNGSAGAMGNGGNGNRLAVPGNAGALAATFEPGQIFSTRAAYEIIDKSLNQIDRVLVDFVSTVEVDAAGTFIYTYTVTNHSDVALHFDWPEAGLLDESLEASGQSDSRSASFVSALAPTEAQGAGNLTLLALGGSVALPANGWVPTLVPTPVPLPASLALMGPALGLGLARIRVRHSGKSLHRYAGRASTRQR